MHARTICVGFQLTVMSTTSWSTLIKAPEVVVGSYGEDRENGSFFCDKLSRKQNRANFAQAMYVDQRQHETL